MTWGKNTAGDPDQTLNTDEMEVVAPLPEVTGQEPRKRDWEQLVNALNARLGSGAVISKVT